MQELVETRENRKYIDEELSLKIYLREIYKIELLTRDEEVRYARRARKGDKQAQDRLTKANLRFVVSVAKGMRFRGVKFADLINAGNIGLIAAVKYFDERKGFKFISYAVWWIRQAMFQEIYEMGRIIRLPSNRMGVINKVKRAEQKLISENGDAQDNLEISRMINVSVAEVEEAKAFFSSHLSFDAPKGENRDGDWLETLPDTTSESTDAQVILSSDQKIIRKAMSTLTAREIEVVDLVNGLTSRSPLTLEEVGERLELTRERIRQIHEKALRRLRVFSRRYYLQQLLLESRLPEEVPIINNQPRRKKFSKRVWVKKSSAKVSPIKLLAKKSGTILAATFSTFNDVEVANWVSVLLDAIYELAPERAASLCVFYGLPLPKGHNGVEQNKLVAQKEYALMDLSKATNIAYFKLKRLLARHQELKSATS